MPELSKIHHYFEAIATQHPNKSAVVDFSGQAITYEALNQQSSALAEQLKTQFNLQPGQLVMIDMPEKSIHLIVSILATLKAECCYTIINTELPDSVVLSMRKRAAPKLILKEEYQEIMINAPQMLDTQPNQYDPNTAYIIFTSGTTGQPKGVPISHANLIPTFNSWREVFNLEPGLNHLQMANSFFDVFQGDWVRALCSGGTLHLYPNKKLLDASELHTHIIDRNIDIAEFVPAILKRLVSYLEGNHPGEKLPLRTLLFGSDICSIEDVRKMAAACPEETDILNTYGLTEATIDSTYLRITPEVLNQIERLHGAHAIVPPGQPFPHVELAVIHPETGAPSSPNETGELVIGGAGVSSGYIGDPTLNEARFITINGALWYKTGDQAFIDSEGSLYLCGRNENQVKIMGKRIELMPIENALASHPAIESALVKQNGTELHAYLVFRTGTTDVMAEDIQAHLGSQLPDDSVPARFFQITAMPLTHNGKVNRNEDPLLQPEQAREIQALASSPLAPIVSDVKAIWIPYLKHIPLNHYDSFAALGGSSLRYVEMINDINEEFNINLKLSDITLCTVMSLAKEISAALKQPAATQQPKNFPTCLPQQSKPPGISSQHRAFSTRSNHITTAGIIAQSLSVAFAPLPQQTHHEKKSLRPGPRMPSSVDRIMPAPSAKFPFSAQSSRLSPSMPLSTRWPMRPHFFRPARGLATGVAAFVLASACSSHTMNRSRLRL
jgi:amino acid adenylation domain-containing protein